MVAVSVSDEIYNSAKHFAETHAMPIEDAVSDLIRQGLKAAEAGIDPVDLPANIKLKDGFYVLSSPDAPPITLERLLEIEAEMEDEEDRKCCP